jgi:uncharacterized oxidoreductase
MAEGFEGKVVLVTGGTAGIGLALVRALARRGAKVVTCGRDARRAAGLEAELPGVMALRCDLASPAELDRLVETVRQLHGRVDCLVHNAGVMEQPDFAAGRVDEAAVRGELRVNLEVPILLTHRLLPLLRAAAAPAIVFVTSGYALLPPRRAPTYAATKAGLRAFAMGLRYQLAPLGIRVVEVLPPLVDTALTADVRKPKLAPEAVAEATLSGLERGRDEILVGQVRFLPALMRLFPGYARRLIARS